MSDVSDQIATDALRPQAVTNDGVTVTKRSIADQIAADKYLRAVAAAESTTTGLGIQFRQIVPPGGAGT